MADDTTLDAGVLAGATSASSEPSEDSLPTALVTGELMLGHRPPDLIPEQPERLRQTLALIEACLDEGLIPRERILRLKPRAATDQELETVHHPSYIGRVRAVAEAVEAEAAAANPGEAAPTRKLATDVYLSPGSWDAATHAAGAALVALDAIAAGQARNAYALVRPPGHHARPAGGMGFCVFNNIAVAARYAQRKHGWERVLIVDYDVHHGNGTQEIFYADPTVTYFSTHQYPWYPMTGASDETGEGPGLGATINVPLPAESGWSVYDPIFRQVLWPVADRFKPDIVLVSAGFDAHWCEDPGLGQMRLSNADFADFTLELREMAERYCAGRLVVVQEGGYNIEALSQCAASMLVNLTGGDGLFDSLGLAPPLKSRWNDEAIVQALYQIHGLAGYRRKARREGRRKTPEYGDEPQAT